MHSNNLSENASSISGGQAQRLFILRTIFEAKKNINNGYKILAMDEPFKGLDENTKNKCIYLLKQVSKTATEVHGGMGFTDELGLHYWFKRIGLNRQLLGSPELIREEAGKLQGFDQ